MVEVKASGSKKKPRKTRKDKGKRRGKRGMKNPRFQTGSIDFRTIGTNATMGQNLTQLAGLIASSRQIAPTFSQDNYLINELRKKEEQITSNELVIKPQNIPPPPQTRPDVSQAQEGNTTQVRQAMGKRIAGLRKEEAVLFLKGKGIEAKNILISNELQINSQKLIEQEGFLTKQKEDLIKGSNYLQKTGLVKILKEQGIEVESSNELTYLRMLYLKSQGLKVNEDYALGTREGARGKASREFDLIPVPKQDLQRAQEERPNLEIPELKSPQSQELDYSSDDYN